MIKTETLCPYSSLNVSREIGGSKRLSPRYRMNYAVLGGAIVYSRPEGHVDEDTIKTALETDGALIEKIRETRKGYVRIEDYAALESSSFRARMIFAEFLSGSDACHGVIFCNLSLTFRTAVKITMPRKRFPCPLLIASDYSQAVEWAQEICEREDIPLDYGSAPFTFATGTRSLFPLEISSLAQPDPLPGEEKSRLLTYLMNGEILYYVLPEIISYDLIDRIAEEGDSLMRHKAGRSISDGSYIMVDGSQLRGVPSPLRRYATIRIKAVMTSESKPEILLFHVTPMGRAVVKLLSPLIPVRLTGIEDPGAALRQVLEKDQADLKAVREGDGACDGQIDRVIALLSAIEWEKRGIPLLPDREEPRMNVVIEALKLIKEELDNLLEEREFARNLDNTFSELEDFTHTLSDSPRLRVEDRKYLELISGRIAASRKVLRR